MQQFYDFDTISTEVKAAIEASLLNQGIDLFHPLAMCAVLACLGSSFKFHSLNGTPLTRPVAEHGIRAYEASITASRVERIKSPVSLTVNPMMDAIAAALLDGAVAPEDLPARALQVLDIDDEKHANEPPGYASALSYLKEAGVIYQDARTHCWALC